MSRQHDRGLRAVARVRQVRERDSRMGLLTALTAVRERETRLVEMSGRLAEASRCESATLDDFVSDRQLLTAMAVAVREAEERLNDARLIATDAHTRWQSDKSRLKAIEHLQEQRAQRRDEEAAREEAREIDDVVGRLQLLARRSGAHQEGSA